MCFSTTLIILDISDYTQQDSVNYLDLSIITWQYYLIWLLIALHHLLQHLLIQLGNYL